MQLNGNPPATNQNGCATTDKKEATNGFSVTGFVKNSANEGSRSRAASSSPSKHSRKDTVQIKNELADALGPNASTYWTTLKRFLSGSYSKPEFDALAANLLGLHQAKLHNQLIMALLYNLQTDVAVPQGKPDTEFEAKNDKYYFEHRQMHLKRPRRIQEEEIPLHDLKRRFISSTIFNLSPADRRRLAFVDNTHQESPIGSTNVCIPKFKDPLFLANGYPKGITNIPRTCIEEFDLLSRETLDQRVAFISAIEGLEQPATADSVDFMSIALENYLKNFIDGLLKDPSIQSAIRDKTLDPTNKRRSASPNKEKDANGVNSFVHDSVLDSRRRMLEQERRRLNVNSMRLMFQRESGLHATDIIEKY